MSDETVSLLQSLDQDFLPLAWSFVAYWRQRGVPVLVISARRSTDIGNTGGTSLHLRGRAIDVSIYLEPWGHIPRDYIPFWWWQELARPWEAAGGRWGGRFNTQDVNHFDSGSSVLSG